MTSAHRRRATVLAASLTVALAPMWTSAATSGTVPASLAAAPSAVPSADGWTLSSTDPHTPAPTFLGNGYFAARIPATGMGFSAVPAPTDAQLAGFYAQLPGYAEQRADIPTWSTLAVRAGSGTFGYLPSALGDGTPQWQGSVRAYRQVLDLRRGLLTTHLTWTAPDGQVTDLDYTVLVDQAREHVAAVRLALTPQWSGTATITDRLDGTDTALHPPDSPTGAIGGVLEGTETQLSTAVAGTDAAARQVYESVHATGTDAVSGVASTLTAPGAAAATAAPSAVPETVSQSAALTVVAGRTYDVTKYVGVSSSHEVGDPLADARAESARAAGLGWDALVAEHVQAWNDLWRGDITVTGDPALQQAVRASLFYLLESTRADSPWSLSPAGLSSAGYNGHVFWDSETWMYPALLALHPDIARAINGYRQTRLGAAESYAQSSGFTGARFPWESAVTGDEQTPAFANTPQPLPGGYFPDTGTFEQHITADVALAQWQYYLATGDRTWLARDGWPVIDQAAEFWAARTTRDASGTYHLEHVMGPDEYRADVNDNTYTNVAAARTLQLATRAAALVGAPAPASWKDIADGLLRSVPYDDQRGIHREDAAYTDETAKQADTILAQYPWQLAMRPAEARRDLAYYAAHTDLGGPSMTDAADAIDAAHLGLGCSDLYYLRRSIDPFLVGPFDQMSETRDGGAFTFLTGAGGVLQELVFGFTGLRWQTDGITLDPTLPPQLPGLALRGLVWHGDTVTIAVRTRGTTVSVRGAQAMAVHVRGRRLLVRPGHPVVLSTRVPGRADRNDRARCRPVAATPSDASYPAVGAVDGDATTAWHPSSVDARVTIDLGAWRARAARPKLTFVWGASRATAWTDTMSKDGRRLTLHITATDTGRPAILDELVVR